MATQVTLRYIINDILRILRQQYPDADITLNHVLYWVLIHAELLKKAYIIGQKTDVWQYVHEFHLDAAVDPVTGRNYFELPQSIYDLPEDRGIAYATYQPEIDPNNPVFTSVQFTRTTIPKSRRLYMRDEERPSPNNPYMYRVGDKIFILGCEQINLTRVEVGLYTSFEAVDSTIDIDAEFSFPQELISELTKEVLSLGLFLLKLPEGWEAENIRNETLQEVDKSFEEK